MTPEPGGGEFKRLPKRLHPRSREKPPERIQLRREAVPQTDTGGRVEDTEALREPGRRN